MLLIVVLLYTIGGQSCINNPNVNQRGSDLIDSGRQVIVPSARINCTGRITGFVVSMAFIGHFISNNFPRIEIWRPSSPGSNVYSNLGSVTLSRGTFIGDSTSGYYLLRLSIINSTDFQFGDVIGYYQPSQPRRVIWNINTIGYTSYSNNVNSPSNTIDINDVDNVETDMQPLIELQFRKNIFLLIIYLTEIARISVIYYKRGSFNCECMQYYEVLATEI